MTLSSRPEPAGDAGVDGGEGEDPSRSEEYRGGRSERAFCTGADGSVVDFGEVRLGA